MDLPTWINKDVLLISFSAFFADLGYQTAVAIFPIFLVITLGASASEYGIASAIAFGVGSFFGYIGGLLSDKYSGKRIAIFGNALIPLISLMALTQSVTIAVILFSAGWWARNFRSPARRLMLIAGSPKKHRSKIFGFLHALDIGGGMISILMLLLLLYLGLSYNKILLLTIIPIIRFAKKMPRLLEPERAPIPLPNSFTSLMNEIKVGSRVSITPKANPNIATAKYDAKYPSPYK